MYMRILFINLEKGFSITQNLEGTKEKLIN